MLTRLAYLIIVVFAGLASIVLCRLSQAVFVESGASWLTGPAQSAVAYPVHAIGDFFDNVEGIGNLRREKEQLQAEVDRLRLDTMLQSDLQQENRQLREQLDLRRARPTYQWTSGRVIGRDPDPLVRALVVDVGLRDGITEGMTVIAPQGLVGKVLRANPNTAKVLLVTDGSSSVNGLIQTTRARGVVSGNSTGRLTMAGIGQGETIHTGDRVITSGLGGNYPPGLLVGTVLDVQQKDVDMFKEARLEPAVDFDRLEVVLVVTSFLPTKLE